MRKTIPVYVRIEQSKRKHTILLLTEHTMKCRLVVIKLPITAISLLFRPFVVFSLTANLLRKYKQLRSIATECTFGLHNSQHSIKLNSCCVLFSKQLVVFSNEKTQLIQNTLNNYRMLFMQICNIP